MCCPGPRVDLNGGDACCVTDGGVLDLVFGDDDCIAKISIDDPDYDDKVDEAQASGTVDETDASATGDFVIEATGAADTLGVDFMVAGLAGLSAVFMGI